MIKKLLMSIAALVAVLGIGGSATYALLSSNTATISATEIDTGSASIKLCRRSENSWKNSVAGFTLAGLIPGDINKDVTGGANVFVGNDNGGLNTLDSCAYGDTATASNVNMKLIPVISAPTGSPCSSQALNDISLKFVVGATDSGYHSLSFWTTNTTQYGDVINVNGTAQIQIFAKMDSTSTQAGQKCTFNMSFTGAQQ